MLAVISYDPLVEIELGPLSISPHGLGIAIGFLVGAWVMLPAARQRGISDDDVYSLLYRALIGAIIGARVAYVINHFNQLDSPIEALKIWEGGISLLGGFVGAILAALPRMRALGLSFWKVMDAAAPGMAVGVVIGRIGDLIVADHLGKTTDFFLGYVCPDARVASTCPAPGVVVHQPALYDLVSTALLFLFLLWLRRKPRYDGFLLFVFATWYGTMRIVEDFFRVDETHGTGLTGSQWTSLVTILVCGSILLFRRRTPQWGRWDETAPAGEPTSEPLGETAEQPAVEPSDHPPVPAPESEPREGGPTMDAEAEPVPRHDEE